MKYGISTAHLSWISATIALISAVGCSSADSREDTAKAADPVIYGTDDRSEYGAITDARVRQWANATAALVKSTKISCSGPSCTLATTPFTHANAFMVGSIPLCSDQAYRGQPVGAFCTAFLIGPDTMMTAGHCFDAAACSDFHVAFGFAVRGDGLAVTTVPSTDVYRCAEVVDILYTGLRDVDKDWAVFRLDRPVQATQDGATRTPLPVRASGIVSNSANLTTIGHGNGLPLKISSNGKVRLNDSTRHRFHTTLDIYGGNSGGPVINSDSGQVEGILVTGFSVNWWLRTNSSPQCAYAYTCTESAVDNGCSNLWTGAMRAPDALSGATCNDGVKSGRETDVDCGGPCTLCALGRACTQASDCATLRCAGGVCGAPTCTDGEHNGTESAVDCGGSCTPCGRGQACATNADCGAHLVCGSGRCSDVNPNSCGNSTMTGRETGLDCGGGICPVCSKDQGCAKHADCARGLFCAAGRCQHAATCNDGVRTGTLHTGETDVDCGGPCAPCGVNKNCVASGDCARGLSCLGGKCGARLPSSCSDGHKGFAETDLDCGGGECPACGERKKCTLNADCATGLFCALGYCRPATYAMSCYNRAKDGNETDVDCGGSCAPCERNRACVSPSDCATNLGINCVGGVCAAPPAQQCSDGTVNGSESAVDCGGNVCSGCGPNLRCATHTDCRADLACRGTACLAP